MMTHLSPLDRLIERLSPRGRVVVLILFLAYCLGGAVCGMIAFYRMGAFE